MRELFRSHSCHYGVGHTQQVAVRSEHLVHLKRVACIGVIQSVIDHSNHR
jgi:hypothetical protein